MKTFINRIYYLRATLLVKQFFRRYDSPFTGNILKRSRSILLISESPLIRAILATILAEEAIYNNLIDSTKSFIIGEDFIEV